MMESTFNDFLNEINEISPPATKITCDWQECFDEGTGFPYYWNIQTNAVTWEMPAEYKKWLESGKNQKQTVDDKPKVSPLFPGASPTVEQEKVKIYQIQEETKCVSPIPAVRQAKEKKKKTKPPRMKSSDSEDEKIVLISSYGGDTETEEEEDEEVEEEKKTKSNQSSQCNSPKPAFNSTTNSCVNSDIEETENKEIPQPAKEKFENVLDDQKPSVPVSGFALLSGYGDSDEEESFQENGTTEPTIAPISHSTLFPVTKPIDINQFMETKLAEKPEEVEDIDKKAFQRKRRIGINLPAMPRRVVPVKDEDGTEHKGLGFQRDAPEGVGFKSGGVAFVKADVLYPSGTEKQNGVVNDADKTQSTVKEKLTFLSEGKEPISGVQMMLIQLETLFAALKYGSLDSNYLNKWIKDTERELVKLEEEAAPSGWLLEWDSVQKRYYYRNKGTNQCQWEYPQADAESAVLVVPPQDDDAMDICTTPPPQQSDVIEEEVVNTVQMPTVSPTPMGCLEEANLDSPIEELVDQQPLPPGVDCLDHKTETKPSNLSLVLNDFYSDIAALESTNSSPKPAKGNDAKEPVTSADTEEPVKKKKKIKMASGISMKKKGVSQLVEKWKNVQKDLE